MLRLSLLQLGGSVARKRVRVVAAAAAAGSRGRAASATRSSLHKKPAQTRSASPSKGAGRGVGIRGTRSPSARGRGAAAAAAASSSAASSAGASVKASSSPRGASSAKPTQRKQATFGETVAARDAQVAVAARPAYMSEERETEVLRMAERMQRRDLTSEVPVASFAYEILKKHPSVREMGLRERMDFLLNRWDRLSTSKKLEYINDPLRGLL